MKINREFQRVYSRKNISDPWDAGMDFTENEKSLDYYYGLKNSGHDVKWVKVVEIEELLAFDGCKESEL